MTWSFYDFLSMFYSVFSTSNGKMVIRNTIKEIYLLQQELINYELFIGLFMSFHVFSVRDFMSLFHFLQYKLTSISMEIF